MRSKQPTAKRYTFRFIKSLIIRVAHIRDYEDSKCHLFRTHGLLLPITLVVISNVLGPSDL